MIVENAIANRCAIIKIIRPMKIISILSLTLLFSARLVAQKESRGTLWKRSQPNFAV